MWNEANTLVLVGSSFLKEAMRQLSGGSMGTFFLLCAWLHNEASPFRSVAVQTLEGNSAANEGGRSESCFRASSQVRSLVQKYVQATHQACSGMVAGHKQGGIFRAADACFESPSMLPCVLAP
eukprot:scaffold80839_cov19-Tisochrysis_lutea.AAC.2